MARLRSPKGCMIKDGSFPFKKNNSSFAELKKTVKCKTNTNAKQRKNKQGFLTCSFHCNGHSKICVTLYESPVFFQTSFKRDLTYNHRECQFWLFCFEIFKSFIYETCSCL